MGYKEEQVSQFKLTVQIGPLSIDLLELASKLTTSVNTIVILIIFLHEFYLYKLCESSASRRNLIILYK